MGDSMTLKPIITPPTELPVTIAQIKAQSIVDFADDDVLLDSYIRAATAYLDGHSGILGRAIMPQAVVQKWSDFSCPRLPYGTVSAVASVDYYDEDNTLQNLTGWTLLEDEAGAYLYLDGDFPDTYDRPDAVSVSYTAGYVDAASVPESIKLAISMLAAGWYCARESIEGERVSSVPFGIEYLIAPHRLVGV